MRATFGFLVAAAVLFAVAPVHAHHAFAAQYDAKKPDIASGLPRGETLPLLPFKVTFTARLAPKGDELMEYICQENNPDVPHLSGQR
jgi:hypothetical protein